MKFSALMAFGIFVFLASMALPMSEANAVVCARGVHHGGCVGRHGAVVVHRRPVHRHVVVVRGRRF